MLCINNAMRQCSEYRELKRLADGGCFPLAASGLSYIHKVALAATLCRDESRRVLILCADDGEVLRFKEDLSSFGVSAVCFPSRDFVFSSSSNVSHEYEFERLGALARILDNKCDVVLASVQAAQSFTMPPEVLLSSRFTIKSGDEMPISEICDRLTDAGYTRCDPVEGAGTFAVRGGILDLFPPDMDAPVRIEFWGDSIDTMAQFDVESQRRTRPLDALTVSPVREVLFESPSLFAERLTEFAAKLPDSDAKRMITGDAQNATNGVMPNCCDKYLPLAYKGGASLLDYTADFITLISESAKIKESADSFYTQTCEDVVYAMEQGELVKGLNKFCLSRAELNGRLGNLDSIIVDTFARGSYGIAVRGTVNFTLKQLPAWRSTISQLKEDVAPLLSDGYGVIIFAGGEKAAKNLAGELCGEGLRALYSPLPDSHEAGKVLVTEGGLSAGFEIPSAKFALIVRGRMGEVKPVRRNKAASINSLDELSRGDLVVHSSYGIGIFDGIQKMTVENVSKDYIKIKYAKQDVLYVPVTQLDLVSKYIGGGDESTVKINRLGSSEWKKTRANVKRALRDIAKDLIKLYAERMDSAGHAFLPDGSLQSEFENKFEYVETDDQLRCAAEIKKDMESTVPMDRLLCGDVGFGKTEVALRAAFKCITEGKQCAILVPTTILAWQHYQTVVRRMEGMAVNVELLSRFRTAKEQKLILKKLARGDIDIIIGTHRIVSNDVVFRDLGLVIIDEEQRFGVAQKEKLRSLKPNVDTLTLTATPIPRTLNMAMTGLRDMSSIEQAPNDRIPVQTYVSEYHRPMIVEAIRRELRRAGQVYYLHNRVDSIERTALMIKEDIPEARVGVAHGKMSEEQLSEVWRRLIDHEIDVLVCTTIIETGVDVPNVNTLIIEDADRMGLAQMHQIRGRVGRSNRRAYAYLTYKGGKVVNEVAQKRLEAIREYTEFGSGFKIAMRDLEIRGAGNILGGEQHGHMDAVGYDMYIKLLTDAISEEKGEKPSRPLDAECTVDLQIPAHIPESYIPSLQSRLGVYRRIADVREQEDARDVVDELIDRFGEPPHEVTGLIDIALLRNRAAAVGITKIEQQGSVIRLYPATVVPEYLEALKDKYKKLFSFNAGEHPYYAVRTIAKVPVDTVAADVIAALEEQDK